MVCPIDLPRMPDANAPASELGQALFAEMDSLSPWYDLAVRTRGRTTVGPSELDLKVAAKFVADFLEDQETPAPRDDLVKGRVLKLAYEDLKAYYGEAITAQPGYGTSLRVENWLFNETAFGKALTLRRICHKSDDEYYQYLGRNSIARPTSRSRGTLHCCGAVSTGANCSRPTTPPFTTVLIGAEAISQKPEVGSFH